MKSMKLVGIAAILLLLAAGAGAASAYTLTLGNLNLAKATDSGEIRLKLDTAPDGIAGYSVTFHLSNPQAAVIDHVTLPVWADPDFASSSGVTNDVTIKLADVTNHIGPTPTPPQDGFYLGSVWVQGVTKGMSSEITVTVNQMDADNGAVILPTVVKGMIDVELPAGSISVSSTGATGAQIYLDGQPVQNPATNQIAVTNYVIPDVPVGTHTVKVSLTGWVADSLEKPVPVESGKMATVTFSMVRAVTIIVQTSPPGADIILNNVPSGQTPATFSRPQGMYTVSVSKPGCTKMSGSKNIIPPLTRWTFSWTLSCTNDPDYHPGRIVVDSDPPGAAIYFDGQYQEADTPGFIETSDTSPKVHTVYVTLENYETPQAWTGSVDEGGMVDLMFELTEKQPVPVPEFPTILVPLVSLVGFSLAVILLKTRKGT